MGAAAPKAPAQRQVLTSGPPALRSARDSWHLARERSSTSPFFPPSIHRHPSRWLIFLLSRTGHRQGGGNDHKHLENGKYSHVCGPRYHPLPAQEEHFLFVRARRFFSSVLAFSFSFFFFLKKNKVKNKQLDLRTYLTKLLLIAGS